MHQIRSKSNREHSPAKVATGKKSTFPTSVWFDSWRSKHSRGPLKEELNSRKSNTLPNETHVIHSDFESDSNLVIKRIRTSSGALMDSSCEDLSRRQSLQLAVQMDNDSQESSQYTSWDETSVDVEQSKEALQNLSVTIQQQRDHLTRILAERTDRVNEFLHNAEDSKARTNFEETNKQSNKQEQTISQQLEFLEYCYHVIRSRGIPKGDNLKDYMKSLRKKKDKKVNDRVIDEAVKIATPSMKKRKKSEQSPVTITVEHATPSIMDHLNLSFSGHEKSSKRDVTLSPASSAQTCGSSASLKPPDMFSKSLSSGERGHKRMGSVDIQSTLSNNEEKDNDTIPVGRARNHSKYERRGSCVSDVDKAQNDAPNGAQYINVTLTQLLAISDEMNSLKAELREVVNSNHEIKADLMSLKLDGETAKNLYAERLDAINRRVEVNEIHCETLNTFKDSAETLLLNFEERFKDLQGKFDYGMSATSRRLQDNSEGIFNKILLLEGRMNSIYRQEPNAPARGLGESGLTNHLVTSILHIVAFTAIILSTGLNFLMNLLNRYNRLAPLPRRLVLTGVAIAVALFSLYSYHEEFQHQLHYYVDIYASRIQTYIPLTRKRK